MLPFEVQKGREIAYYAFYTRVTIAGEVYDARDYGHRAFRIPVYR